jgi:hypothetical protein
MTDKKEKEYRITYTTKVSYLKFFIPLIAFLTLLFPFIILIKYSIPYIVENNNLFVITLIFVSCFCILIWLASFVISFVGSFIRITKQEDGDENVERIEFAGNLKSIEEVIYPKESKPQKTKYKEIYKLK